MFLAVNYCCKALHLRCFASLGYVSEYDSQGWCLQVLKTSSRHILNTCKLSLFWILWSLLQYILHRNKECAKLRASFAFVSCVPHLPTCLTCLRVYVLTCLTCLRAFASYMPSFLTCPTCLHFLMCPTRLLFFMCPTCPFFALRAFAFLYRNYPLIDIRFYTPNRFLLSFFFISLCFLFFLFLLFLKKKVYICYHLNYL